MNKVLLAGFFMVLLLQSCFRSKECDPNKICDTNKPDSSWVNIQFSATKYGIGVPFIIYNGDAEDELVVLRDTAFTDKLSYYLPISERYSVKAVYLINTTANTTRVTAYDGGKLRLEKSWNCDERCYSAPDLNLDCRLLE
ncbi:MAG TPA: hypothetical protein DEP18_06650 [Flavobacteriales bacterium]|nr:hypothetical protein [Flavobacteriales bacterium]HCA83449.1 hypothetical protein [Flavobacteriales bacterium]HRE74567.1 hypothetical protein [Flavobacteriales bacterium]HRE96943.1 hypothetical protein [Flavobacteriales bacterium]HRJ36327.1 hypothetical protein [Flavobacteriales bacterium]